MEYPVFEKTVLIEGDNFIIRRISQEDFEKYLRLLSEIQETISK